jgi:hypothetical protein
MTRCRLPWLVTCTIPLYSLPIHVDRILDSRESFFGENCAQLLLYLACDYLAVKNI